MSLAQRPDRRLKCEPSCTQRSIAWVIAQLTMKGSQTSHSGPKSANDHDAISCAQTRVVAALTAPGLGALKDLMYAGFRTVRANRMHSANCASIFSSLSEAS